MTHESGVGPGPGRVHRLRCVRGGVPTARQLFAGSHAPGHAALHPGGAPPGPGHHARREKSAHARCTASARRCARGHPAHRDRRAGPREAGLVLRDDD
ncbi:hypothetical protein QJS66_21370 [Kocuria rhizophila]|nr:hypothetical protein QJS66_21370 [Kocuria rhizophila]